MKQTFSRQQRTTNIYGILCLVLIYLLVNLIVDVLYGFLDPRISHD